MKKPSLIKLVKWIIHLPALALSLVMVVDTLSNISVEPFWRNFFIGCAFYVELFGQFARGLAAAYGREKKMAQARLCWLLVFIYIGAFAGVSAVGVFMTKVSAEEVKIQVSQDDYETAHGKFLSAKALYDAKVAAQDLEYRQHGGKGDKYDSLGVDVTKAKADMDAAEAQMNLAGKTKMAVNAHRSVFTYLPPWAKIPMFIAIMVVIYTGLLLTPWPIDLKWIFHDIESKTEEPPTPPTPNVTVVTPDPLPVTSNVTKKEPRYCEYSKCGKPIPDGARSDKHHCDLNCRVAAFREKEALEKAKQAELANLPNYDS